MIIYFSHPVAPSITFIFLQIFSLDFGSSERELKLAGGAVQAPERFARLAWGAPGADHATYPVRQQLISFDQTNFQSQLFLAEAHLPFPHPHVLTPLLPFFSFITTVWPSCWRVS